MNTLNRHRYRLLALLCALVVVFGVGSAGSTPADAAFSTSPKAGSPSTTPDNDSDVAYYSTWTMTSPGGWGYRTQYTGEPSYFGTSGSVTPSRNAPGYAATHPSNGSYWNTGGCQYPVYLDRWGTLRDSATGRVAYYGRYKQAARVGYAPGYSSHVLADGRTSWYNPNYVCLDAQKPPKLVNDLVTTTGATVKTFNPLSNDGNVAGLTIKWLSLPNLNIYASGNSYRWDPRGAPALSYGRYTVCGTDKCFDGSATVTFQRSSAIPPTAPKTLISTEGQPAYANLGSYSSDYYLSAPCTSINSGGAPGVSKGGCSWNPSVSWVPNQKTNDRWNGSYTTCSETGCTSAGLTFLAKAAPVVSNMDLRTSGGRPVVQQIPVVNLYNGTASGLNLGWVDNVGLCSGNARGSLSLYQGGANPQVQWTPSNATGFGTVNLTYRVHNANGLWSACTPLTITQGQVQPS